jgi:hypothetical protein
VQQCSRCTRSRFANLSAQTCKLQRSISAPPGDWRALDSKLGNSLFVALFSRPFWAAKPSFDRRSGCRRIGGRGSSGETKSVGEWRKRKADMSAVAGIKKAETLAGSSLANMKIGKKAGRRAHSEAARLQDLALLRLAAPTSRRACPAAKVHDVADSLWHDGKRTKRRGGSPTDASSPRGSTRWGMSRPTPSTTHNAQVSGRFPGDNPRDAEAAQPTA